MEQGGRKEVPVEEMKWQRMLIPIAIGMGHLGRKWREKNNELIYELRREHMMAQRLQRAQEVRPPPKPPPAPAPSGVGGRGEKRSGAAGETRRSKRARRTVHKAFFVR